MNEFARYCAKRDIENVKRIVSLPDFDPQWIFQQSYYSPLYYACMMGHPELVEILLKYLDVIPIRYLHTACIPASDKRDNDFLKTVELLLKHGKFDYDVNWYDLPDLNDTNFDKQLKIIFDEYEFRLDGTKYNENII